MFALFASRKAATSFLVPGIQQTLENNKTTWNKQRLGYGRLSIILQIMTPRILYPKL